ncbi:hypothetical protein KY285_033529 [Solanum tuberosum]|nr:hypothetical protein KY285_033529 [Solanum tuberosum]
MMSTPTSGNAWYAKGVSIYDAATYLGLLQPLSIPSSAWSNISMDFIDGLPKSKGKTTIMIVVDRLTKSGHFISLSNPYTSASVAQIFLDLKTPCQADWSLYVALDEWWYNISFHSAIQTTPYEALYGQPPLLHFSYVSSEASDKEIDRSMLTRECKKIGPVAYKLNLTSHIAIHPTFHGNKAVVQLLIQWKDMVVEQATWEDYSTMKIMFTTLFLEDKNVFKKGEMMQNEVLMR